MDKYLKETKMLDYSNANIQQLIRERRWKNINEFERLKSIYDFVRDEILFGYNIDDNVPASKVLADGYGQCNTKGTLFMAILRACNIPCRVHGFTIDKKLQKGAMTGVVYKNAPQNVFHSWVEVYFEDRWYELEAFILDKKYLQKLIDTCKERGIEVIMTTAPIAPVSYDYISNYECIHDVFQKIADENNLTYLDFNLVNAKEHILTNDNFRDDAHLNDSGVKIVDKYMIDHGYLN